MAAVDQLDEIKPQRCREHVLDHFTYERMAREYERLYARLQERHG